MLSSLNAAMPPLSCTTFTPRISALPIVFQWSACLVFPEYYPRERKMKHKTEINNMDNQSQTFKVDGYKKQTLNSFGNICLSFFF